VKKCWNERIWHPNKIQIVHHIQDYRQKEILLGKKMLGQKNQISRSIPDHVFAQLFFCPAPKFDSADDQLAGIHFGKKMLGQKNSDLQIDS
jgi:hypothetical protein